MMHRLIAWGLLLLFVGSTAGCGGSAGSREIAAARARFLLAEEPADPLGVLDAKETASMLGEVTIVGRIGGVPEPWSKGKALFVISDAAAGDAAEGHVCSEGCPFCSKKQSENEAIAVVQFVDAAGRVLPLDARELFDLAERQMVVIRGRATTDELGCLVLSASGLYVRR